LCYRYLDTRIQKGVQANKNGTEDFIFNTVSDLGLGRTQTIGILSVGAASLIFKNTRLKKTVLIWAGSLFINSIATDQLKTTFQRHRPNTGDPYNTFDWRRGPNLNRSFPSGHTTNAFTTATVWAMQYHDKKWVPYVAYGLATLVGMSRIYHNAHWASDVITGAAVGYGSARAMTAIYRLASKKIRFLPEVENGHVSMQVVYSF
jgi:membrane-associated phospholipid phosphatase